MLARAGDYLRDFERQLSSIVAEETDLQEYTFAGAAGSLNRPQMQRRKLRSDLLLMRPEGDTAGCRSETSSRRTRKSAPSARAPLQPGRAL